MTILPADATTGARARLGAWPHDPDVVQIVMLDHQMVPTVADVRRWIEEATDGEPHRVRTGALFPAAAAAFAEAGFEVIDSLVLLEARLDRSTLRHNRRPWPTTRRMRAGQLAQVAALDRDAFGDTWGNDERALRDIATATPRHRSRVVTSDGRLDGFAISGQSGRTGYLQRLAVDPRARRRGIAQLLVIDAMRWMVRRGASNVLVNTALDNEAALRLYHGLGFERRPESLSILELDHRR